MSFLELSGALLQPPRDKAILREETLSALWPWASAVLSSKLAKMIEAREKEQKKKQKHQENIAKAEWLKKDWKNEQAVHPEKNYSENYASLKGPIKVSFRILWQYY